MKYISTRGNFSSVSAIEAIKLGMVPDGGLFVPKEIPLISKIQLEKWKNYLITSWLRIFFNCSYLMISLMGNRADYRRDLSREKVWNKRNHPRSKA